MIKLVLFYIFRNGQVGVESVEERLKPQGEHTLRVKRNGKRARER